MKYLPVFFCLFLLACDGEQAITEADDPQFAPTPVIFEQGIGTQYFQWTDHNRTDQHYGGPRVVNVQLWYPADLKQSDTLPSTYYHPAEQLWEQLDGWEESDVEWVSEFETEGWLNASVSAKADQYPLLVFSPSLGSHASLYTYYAEQLAKKGFIVMGVTHGYDSEFVMDENGNAIQHNESFYDSLKALSIPDQISAEGYRIAMGPRQRLIGGDLMFCIDQLQHHRVDGISNHIDFERIGCWGHSIGGAAAISSSLMDARIKAVLNIDGTPPTERDQYSLGVPFMFIEDLTDYENHEGYAKQYHRREAFCKMVNADAYRVMLAGTDHNSFLDINLHLAETDEERAQVLKILQKTERFIEDFFCHYLQGEPLQLEDHKSDTLEVTTFAGPASASDL